ncbi:MAG: hypothetical protein K2N30_01680 [Clostridia bacterium]|nr:hypothetical protein [Clostridia bacterium]
MTIRGQRVTPFTVSVIAVVAATVIVIICAASCNGGTIKFKTSFYFVCYAIEDNAISAGSMSSAVSSYGGAGYILEHKNNFYVTVSCYYEQRDAESVCASLKHRLLHCEVLNVDTDSYSLPASARGNAELYKGNLNTLLSLSNLAYGCANSLDTGAYGQNEAKGVILNIESGLKGLLTNNAENCFSPHLRSLSALCTETRKDYVFSKDLRKLQIAIADVIINVKLY